MLATHEMGLLYVCVFIFNAIHFCVYSFGVCILAWDHIKSNWFYLIVIKTGFGLRERVSWRESKHHHSSYKVTYDGNSNISWNVLACSNNHVCSVRKSLGFSFLSLGFALFSFYPSDSLFLYFIVFDEVCRFSTVFSTSSVRHIELPFLFDFNRVSVTI